MPLDYPIHERTLANGLRIVVSPDHKACRPSPSTLSVSGRVTRWPGRTGFAHLFEHLMFQGRARSPVASTSPP